VQTAKIDRLTEVECENRKVFKQILDRQARDAGEPTEGRPRHRRPRPTER
jgi:hypothetical protein